MKVVERVLDKRRRIIETVDEIQFCFIPKRGCCVYLKKAARRVSC